MDQGANVKAEKAKPDLCPDRAIHSHVLLVRPYDLRVRRLRLLVMWTRCKILRAHNVSRII